MFDICSLISSKCPRFQFPEGHSVASTPLTPKISIVRLRGGPQGIHKFYLSLFFFFLIPTVCTNTDSPDSVTNVVQVTVSSLPWRQGFLTNPSLLKDYTWILLRFNLFSETVVHSRRGRKVGGKATGYEKHVIKQHEH